MPDFDSSEAGFPLYARNMPSGPTPKGIPVEEGMKMGKTIVKMAKLLPKRSLLRRVTKYPRTNKRRYF